MRHHLDIPLKLYFPSISGLILTKLANFTIFRSVRDQNNAEISKTARVQAPATRKDSGMQTRQLREAGISTNSDRIILRSGKLHELTVANSCQTNKFKPANHGVVADAPSAMPKMPAKLENDPELGTSEADNSVGLGKSRSLGSVNAHTRSRGLKTSTRDTMEVASGKRSVTCPDQLLAEDEMLGNSAANSSASLTASTGEELAKKLRSDDKSNQKLTLNKNKDDHSADESSVKSGKAAKEVAKVKGPNNKEKQKQCLTWMGDISKLEAEIGMEFSQTLNDDDMPKYCSNKICPISEDKIPKIPKVLGMAKKVTLRKVVFEDQDERWYCIKCLKAHNESLFCFYCGQIYFVGTTDYEDDGKPWIMCDDCDKWVSRLFLS
jgi:hypothetical protein